MPVGGSSWRQVEWARRERERLVKLMGGRCVRCGTDQDLQFDHRDGLRTWICRDLSRWMRMVLYRREHAEGKLQLLCSACNRLKIREDFARREAACDRPF